LTPTNAEVQQFSDVVDDLGVRLDSQLTMANHIAALSRSCFFQLRQLRSIKQSLTIEATMTLVHAFVGSRLDYCNIVLVGVSGQLLHKLQVIQNVAARIITGTKKYERMKPVLQDLRWLPIRQRITYKTALLMYPQSGTIIPCGMLSADVTLRRCHRPFQPPVRQHPSAAGSTNKDMLRRPEFPGQRSRCVEQSAGSATIAGHITVHI